MSEQPGEQAGEGRQPSRSDRLLRALERDGPGCVWCGRELTRRVPPTTDHLVPRVKGGPSWLENEAAACRRCNGERGHTAPVEWLLECRRRGWPADPVWLRRRLEDLEGAIAVRGGQRRARPYVEAQLRRARRLDEAA